MAIMALVLSNIVPVIGVAFLGWSLFDVMFVYWVENIVIGFWNVVKMLTAQRGESDSLGAILFVVVFFIFHYGLFCVGHGVFVFLLFGSEFQNGQFEPFQNVSLTLSAWLAVAALFVSHGVTYFHQFLGQGGYKNPGDLMGAPYGRMMVLHFTLVLGGGLVMVLNQPFLALLLLVILKIGYDWSSYRKQQQKLKGELARRQTDASNNE